MPLYDFYCPHCLNTGERVFRMNDVPSVTTCTCGALSYRKYDSPNISCTVSRYSQVLGIDTANKVAVQDMQRRYNDTTGNHLVEAGNEDIRARQPSPVDWDRVARDAKVMEGCASA